MTDLREAAKLALEALENPWNAGPNGVADAIAALKRAIANDAMDKMVENARELGLDYGCPNCASLMEQNTELDKKLAEWVGLTEEELYEIFDAADDGQSPCGVCGACGKCSREVAIAEAVESKLKEKNT